MFDDVFPNQGLHNEIGPASFLVCSELLVALYLGSWHFQAVRDHLISNNRSPLGSDYETLTNEGVDTVRVK